MQGNGFTDGIRLAISLHFRHCRNRTVQTHSERMKEGKNNQKEGKDFEEKIVPMWLTLN
jgi:hypothetical protein